MRPACETFWGVRVGLKGDDRPSCICAEREPKSSPKATSARVGRLVAPDVPGASGSSPPTGRSPADSLCQASRRSRVAASVPS